MTQLYTTDNIDHDALEGQIIAILGYYTSVAMVLNVFQVPVSELDLATPPMRD